MLTRSQERQGRRPKQTPRENVRSFFRCLDVLIITGLVLVLLYLAQEEYGIDVIGIATQTFPREAAVFKRVFQATFG